MQKDRKTETTNTHITNYITKERKVDGTHIYKEIQTITHYIKQTHKATIKNQ